MGKTYSMEEAVALLLEVTESLDKHTDAAYCEMGSDRDVIRKALIFIGNATGKHVELKVGELVELIECGPHLFPDSREIGVAVGSYGEVLSVVPMSEWRDEPNMLVEGATRLTVKWRNGPTTDVVLPLDHVKKYVPRIRNNR